MSALDFQLIRNAFGHLVFTGADGEAHTGVGLALEKFLSPVFIAGDDYGTRASTVLTLGSKGRGVLVERVFHAGRPQGSRRLSFAVQASARAC